MNPLLTSFIGAIVRWLATIVLVDWAAKHGIFSGNDAAMYVNALVIASPTLLWSLWSKYKDRIKLVLALWLPHGSTENDIKDHLKAGEPRPTVLTPPHTVPGVPLPPND